MAHTRRAIDDLFTELKRLIAAERQHAFDIGDLVNCLKSEHQLTVKEIAQRIGASRQRLSELRRTAEAFTKHHRREGIDIHFYTIAARAARRLKIEPAKVLHEVVRRRIGSTRQATAFLAQKIRQKESRQAITRSRRTLVVSAELVNRCHHADFRAIVPQLADESVKLIVADAPYGQYGKFPDGQHVTVSATRRECDGLDDAGVQTVVTDLLRLLRPKLGPGGCLILFRPGAVLDTIWLLQAIADHGWNCERVLTWNKLKPKLGAGTEPYTVGTERLLVLARRGDRLINHDGSDRSDLLQFSTIRPRTTDGYAHHLFEKPPELCRHLIQKHTHPGDLVVEPFGGSAAISSSAKVLGRRWVYCETNRRNFQRASAHLTETTPAKKRKTG